MKKSQFHAALEKAIRAKFHLRGARLNFHAEWTKGFTTIAVFTAWRTGDVKRDWRAAHKYELTADEITAVLQS